MTIGSRSQPTLPGMWIALVHGTKMITENMSSPKHGMVGVAFFRSFSWKKIYLPGTRNDFYCVCDVGTPHKSNEILNIQIKIRHITHKLLFFNLSI